MDKPWTEQEIPDLTRKTAIVTGASSGLGYETARALAIHGAEVVLAVRNLEKGRQAEEQIKKIAPDAKVSLGKLDLGDLNSIHQFADSFSQIHRSLSLLINNAGVMMPPYGKTEDGFELQFGINFLGHFALTGLLFHKLTSAANSRVVTLSSLAAHHASIDFDNLDGSKGYRPMKFYSQSKLADLLFARQLQYKFDELKISSLSVAAHPGISHTNLSSRNSGKKANRLFLLISKLISQPASMGALPTLFAATSGKISGGEYIGPDGKGGRKGYPFKEPLIERLYDAAVAQKLWAVAEQMTGVTYPVPQQG